MKLASPGYKRSQLVGYMLAPSKEQTIEFKGLNRRSFIEPGEMSDMQNLSSDDYPLLAPRKLRGEYTMPADLVRPLQIVARYNRIAIIGIDNEENVGFWYDKQRVTKVTGLNISSRMTIINTKVVFLPQKTYLELFSDGSNYVIGDYASLEASVSLSNATVTISNEDARVTVPADHGFKYDDAINIEGTLTYDSGSESYALPVTLSMLVEDVVNDTTIVLPRETFIELTGDGATNIKLAGTVSRTMPNLDHVIEWNNRLWGASNADNTIYACKLGDPTNWQYFQTTSLDSFYAQQGTDGLWTGVAAYSNHVIFFKQSGMCRVYGTAPSNFQVTSTKCFGVEDGSRLSVVTINDTVFYKSSIGIMAYSGGDPVCISENLGQNFGNVIAGSEGAKYYASAQRKTRQGGYEVIVFDIDKRLWYREDNLRFKGSCAIGNKLHFIVYDDPELLCSDNIFASPYLVSGRPTDDGYINIINPDDPSEKYEDLEWMAQFGPFHEYLEEKKIYSKLAVRFKANDTSSVKVYIAIDEGNWELVKDFTLAATNGEVIPIIPRRCDRYSIRIEGQGNCEIVSLTRRVREGTFGKL